MRGGGLPGFSQKGEQAQLIHTARGHARDELVHCPEIIRSVRRVDESSELLDSRMSLRTCLRQLHHLRVRLEDRWFRALEHPGHAEVGRPSVVTSGPANDRQRSQVWERLRHTTELGWIRTHAQQSEDMLWVQVVELDLHRPVHQGLKAVVGHEHIGDNADALEALEQRLIELRQFGESIASLPISELKQRLLGRTLLPNPEHAP